MSHLNPTDLYHMGIFLLATLTGTVLAAVILCLTYFHIKQNTKEKCTK